MLLMFKVTTGEEILAEIDMPDSGDFDNEIRLNLVDPYQIVGQDDTSYDLQAWMPMSGMDHAFLMTQNIVSYCPVTPGVESMYNDIRLRSNFVKENPERANELFEEAKDMSPSPEQTYQVFLDLIKKEISNV